MLLYNSDSKNGCLKFPNWGIDFNDNKIGLPGDVHALVRVEGMRSKTFSPVHSSIVLTPSVQQAKLWCKLGVEGEIGFAPVPAMVEHYKTVDYEVLKRESAFPKIPDYKEFFIPQSFLFCLNGNSRTF